MNFSGWLILGVALISLYLLGLVLYRLWLNAKALKAELDKAKSLIDQAQQFESLEITPAEPATSDQLGELLLERRKFVRQREKKAEDRQRRLVHRIRDIEIDKR